MKVGGVGLFSGSPAVSTATVGRLCFFPKVEGFSYQRTQIMKIPKSWVQKIIIPLRNFTLVHSGLL